MGLVYVGIARLQGQVCFGSIAKHSLPPPDAALPGVLLPGGRRGARARQVQRALLFRVDPGALAAPPAPRRSPRARGGTSRGVFALCFFCFVCFFFFKKKKKKKKKKKS